MSELKTDPTDQPCLACDKVMFQTRPLDESGDFARIHDSETTVESDADDVYFVCPHCGAKNVVVSEARKGEGVRLRISHIKN
jgi:hypothetical protein